LKTGTGMKSEGRSEYVFRAREAERRARETQDSFTRGVWREIAEGYWRMAGTCAAAPAGEKAAG
jgi:hypothetical protein